MYPTKVSLFGKTMDEEKSIISTTYVDPLPDTQLREEASAAALRIADAYAKGTRAGYAASWRIFQAWCADRGLPITAVTPEIMVTYLEHRLQNGLGARTTVREYGGIAAFLREIQPKGPWLANSPPELVRRWLKGAQKQAKPVTKKRPLKPEHFAMLADRPLNGTLVAARDRALLLFGFSGGFRRSELVALDVDDLRFDTRGAIVRLRRSKTDQDAKGLWTAIWRSPGRRCPVAALEFYLEWANIEQGAVFRCLRHDKPTDRRLYDRAVAMIVKDAVQKIGLDSRLYAGHSLRVGFITAAAERGASIDEIMNTTHHRSADQVVGYIHRESPFERNASRGMLVDEDYALSCGRGHVHADLKAEGSYCLRDECGADRGTFDKERRIEWRATSCP
jgi:site-specific recombinase XerD